MIKIQISFPIHAINIANLIFQLTVQKIGQISGYHLPKKICKYLQLSTSNDALLAEFDLVVVFGGGDMGVVDDIIAY